MEIELNEITIREITNGYVNDEEEGVVSYSGKLNIRPKYQREYVYPDDLRNSVIETINKNFPLNVMYWVKNKDGSFEVLDGQQRTISICEYVTGFFSVDHKYFHNLTDVEQNQILDYKLMIYFCEGNDKEKLDWFKIVNIAGLKLSDQELLNAIYTGSWLSDAKRYFSKSGCPAYEIAKGYMKGASIRQEYLETIIIWISRNNIEEYMAQHHHDSDAQELWSYFNAVINWINKTFTTYRREMKGVDFGTLYNDFSGKSYQSKDLEKEIAKLMQDEDISKKSGIYPYVITGDDKHLNLRSFSEQKKREAYERQKGICSKCKEHFEYEEMHGDHIKPWSKGGKTVSDNCSMLCIKCNRQKSDK